SYGAASFSKDGKSIYYTSDDGSEFHELRKMDIATRATKSLTQNIPWDVENVSITDDRSKIAFLVNDNGRSDLYLMDTSSDKFKQANGIPVGVIGALSWNPNGTDVAINMSNANTSSDA